MASDWRFIVSGTAVDPETSYGFIIQNYNGAGMPPLNNISTDFGLLDGGIFQRQRAGVRTMTLNGIVNGSSVTDLHTKRKSLINAVKPDRSASQQAMIIQYTGGASTVQASAFYDDGLSLGNVDVYREAVAMRFLMYDPYWEKTTSSSATLTVQSVIGASNERVAQRSACGTWAATGIQPNGIVYSIDSASDGALYMGGSFTTASGATANRVLRYRNGGASQLGTSGISGGDVISVKTGGDGFVYAGGAFTTVDGTSACCLARHNGTSWSNLSGSLVSATVVRAIAIDTDGNVIAGGRFIGASPATGASVSACGVIKWNVSSSTWQSIASGVRDSRILGPQVYTVAVAQNGDIWAGGTFLAVGASGANQTTSCFIGYYSNSASTWRAVGASGYQELVSGSLSGSYIETLAIANNGDTYFAGATTDIFTTTGTGVYVVASTISSLGGKGGVHKLFNNSYRNEIIFSGEVVYVNNVNFNRVGRIVGNTPTNLDIIPPASSIVWATHAASDGIFTMAWDLPGSASVAAATTVTNNGTANTYPILTACAPTSTSSRLIQLFNYTTNEVIYFNLPLLRGEIVTLDLRIGKKTFTSNIRGNILNAIVPGTNLTTWHLAPGNNTVSFFLTGGSGAAKLTWTERFWSIDV